ncbi:anthocyanin regulatory R-S protein-like [Macadamia integrifolia]|uniref:anthocyanin regulatory R-S protein-like n=1 Tax=Macadamia integrifolia TaxID=60698 RepID=UPI001C502069|nr:anthocyanin regulatory R-S protein-like [Macadamia integrifolia]
MAIDWNEWDTDGSLTHRKSGETTTALGIDPRERHKLAERERRKSMRELFLSLYTLLPNSNTIRKEQSAILDEIIKYIPLAVARLRSLQNRKDPPYSTSSRVSQWPAPPVQTSDRHSASSDSSEFDIRVADEASSSCVSIRIRGDRVNVSLTDTNPKGISQVLPLSAILDELEAHHLEIVRSTHCRDGSKILHHTECKICDGLDKSPPLEQLAGKLHWLRKSSSSVKRKFDQLN